MPNETQNAVVKKTTETISMEDLLNSNLVKNLANNLRLSEVQIAKANSAVLKLMTDDKLEGTTQISKVRFCYEIAGLNYKNQNAIAPIKYGNAIQAQAQYQAFIEDMLDCGGVTNFDFTLLYEGVEYHPIIKNSFTILTIPKEIKAPSLFEQPKVIGYYAYADTKDYGLITKVMSIEQVKQHAQTYSKAYKGSFSPYVSNFNAMGLKTVIKAVAREVLKRYPYDRLSQTINLDMAVFDEQGVSYKDNPTNDVPNVEEQKTNVSNSIAFDNETGEAVNKEVNDK